MTTTTVLTADAIRIPTLSNDVAAGQAKGAAMLMTLSHAVATDLDPTNPDSLFAFFKVQMDDTRAKLSEAMQQQEVRAEDCKQLEAIQGRMTEYAGMSGIKPGDPKWDQFVDDTRDAIARVGPDTKEGQAIQATLDQAMAPQDGPPRFVTSLEEAKAVQARGGSFQVIEGPLTQYLVTEKNGPGAGATKDQLTSISQQLKARTDALQSETSMAMIRVQQYVDQCSQIVSNCSNVIRKFDEMAMAPIQNIRS